MGTETGNAVVADGVLIIPLKDHDGILRLLLQGDRLEGSGVLYGKTWQVTLQRAQGPSSR